MHLNLPTYPFKLKKQQNKPFIYDQIRKKFVSLNPEEWVRQHIISYLITHKNISKAHIAVERQIVYLNTTKRFDVLVFNKNAETDILIECKAPSIQLNSETALQLALYNQQFKCKIIIISNGLQHFSWQLNSENQYELFSFFD
ncbi:MAG: type I restriction enzyme HsdR N-terminal domain-containing protein [Bacteroidota bacterium]